MYKPFMYAQYAQNHSTIDHWYSLTSFVPDSIKSSIHRLSANHGLARLQLLLSPLQ